MNERQRILLETTAARDKAQTLLRGLVDAQAKIAVVRTGSVRAAQSIGAERTSMDSAISSVQRLIETYNRELEQFRDQLSDEDIALLDER